MIYNVKGESITVDGSIFAVGDRIIATDSDYVGLKGYITEIRTGADKETENETDDIYCCFDLPRSEEGIRLVEEYFSDLYGKKMTRDNIAVDMIIMAPDEIRRLAVNE